MLACCEIESAGGVTVNRDGFGARGKPTLFPLDADLNLPNELFSFGVRRRAAEAAAQGSFPLCQRSCRLS